MSNVSVYETTSIPSRLAWLKKKQSAVDERKLATFLLLVGYLSPHTWRSQTIINPSIVACIIAHPGIVVAKTDSLVTGFLVCRKQRGGGGTICRLSHGAMSVACFSPSLNFPINKSNRKIIRYEYVTTRLKNNFQNLKHAIDHATGWKFQVVPWPFRIYYLRFDAVLPSWNVHIKVDGAAKTAYASNTAHRHKKVICAYAKFVTVRHAPMTVRDCKRLYKWWREFKILTLHTPLFPRLLIQCKWKLQHFPTHSHQWSWWFAFSSNHSVELFSCFFMLKRGQ